MEIPTPSSSALITHFAQVPDPRTNHARRHNLLDIIVIAICAVICGADDWVEVAHFGRCKLDWFRSFLELPHNIPSHDTFGRVFALLNPEAFESSFRSWTAALDVATEGMVIGLDGKTVRRSHDQALGKSAIHMVSAWAGAGRVVLGQTKVDAKSNEITAIPELLKLIDVTGATVTIDAMGCQKDIAAEIVRQQADYVLAVKHNQPHLYQDIAALFATAPLPLHEFTQTAETGHGRREVRYCSVISDPNLLSKIRGKDDWADLKSVIRVTAVRQVGKAKRTIHERLYICSLQANAKEALETVRGHWSIENSQHWVLDVAFREDESRIRKGNAPENFAVLRRIALNLLKGESEVKAGIKTKRHVAGWDEKYLLGLLLG